MNFFLEKYLNFHAVVACEIKTWLSPQKKASALNFSSTWLFTGGVNRMKFINFHAPIILELNLAAVGAARSRRALNFSSVPCEALLSSSELIVWGLTSWSSSSHDKSPPLARAHNIAGRNWTDCSCSSVKTTFHCNEAFARYPCV